MSQEEPEHGYLPRPFRMIVRAPDSIGTTINDVGEVVKGADIGSSNTSHNTISNANSNTNGSTCTNATDIMPDVNNSKNNKNIPKGPSKRRSLRNPTNEEVNENGFCGQSSTNSLLSASTIQIFPTDPVTSNLFYFEAINNSGDDTSSIQIQHEPQRRSSSRVKQQIKKDRTNAENNDKVDKIETSTNQRKAGSISNQRKVEFNSATTDFGESNDTKHKHDLLSENGTSLPIIEAPSTDFTSTVETHTNTLNDDAATLPNTVTNAFFLEEKGRYDRIVTRSSLSNKLYSSSVISKSLPASDILNDEFCWSCKGFGRFICCDACPRSFHFLCIDPPMEEGDTFGSNSPFWYCKRCFRSSSLRKKRFKLNSTSSLSLAATLLHNMNPCVFSLSDEIRGLFLNGSYFFTAFLIFNYSSFIFLLLFIIL